MHRDSSQLVQRGNPGHYHSDVALLMLLADNRPAGNLRLSQGLGEPAHLRHNQDRKLRPLLLLSGVRWDMLVRFLASSIAHRDQDPRKPREPEWLWLRRGQHDHTLEPNGYPDLEQYSDKGRCQLDSGWSIDDVAISVAE